MSNPQISESRQTLYYLGLIMAIVGGIVCIVSFGSLLLSSGSFPGPNPGGLPGGFIGFFIGMVGTMIGGILMRLGKMGVAGSGVILDPNQARKDVFPWSKMAGGVLKDVLDESGIREKTSSPAPEEKEDFETTLRKLHQLHADGILSDAEYADRKKAILEKIG